MRILFDEFHGQPNWAEAGRTGKELSTTFSGIGAVLRREGYTCQPLRQRVAPSVLEGNTAIIIPPPVGKFRSRDLFSGEWFADYNTYFSGEEIESICRFVEGGGRLLAFTYRFGDAFTKANLGDLTAEFGWEINTHAVIEKDAQPAHPLHTTFETTRSDIVQPWAAEGVRRVLWRPLTTFSKTPSCQGQPLIFSPASCTIKSYKEGAQIDGIYPICVAGKYGLGRYILVGGPNVFEDYELGFLKLPDNRRLLLNLLSWLLDQDTEALLRPDVEDRVSSIEDEEHIVNAPAYIATNECPEAAALRVEAKMVEARDAWCERLEFLLVELSKVADPGTKFQLKHQVSEARDMLRGFGFEDS